MRNIEETRICDITLCQGEKSPKMSFRETIELCKMLDKLDVDYIALKGIKQSKTEYPFQLLKKMLPLSGKR